MKDSVRQEGFERQTSIFEGGKRRENIIIIKATNIF